jgi:predicted RNA binding protein YcfA (HicA-like mRNA interferase family)
MVKPAKLYAKLAESPKQIVGFRDFERLLVSFGFTLQRTRGSHRAYKHRAVPELLIVQPKGKDAKPYQIRKFLDMTEQFGLELDE